MSSRGWEHVTLHDIQRKAAPAKPHKYHAEPTTIDGQRFDSKREAKRWMELKALEHAGEITDLERQVPYALHVMARSAAGTDSEIGTYVADFVYREHNRATHTRTWVVEDVKGAKTLPLAKWKQKHLAAEYGILVREVR